MPEGAVWGGVGALFTTVIGAIIAWYRQLRAQHRAEKKEDKEDERSQWRMNYTLLQKSHEELGVELKAERHAREEAERHTLKCEIRLARLEARIEHHEETMKAAGLTFRPYVPPPEITSLSGVHQASPPTGGS